MLQEITEVHPDKHKKVGKISTLSVKINHVCNVYTFHVNSLVTELHSAHYQFHQ